MYNNPPELRGLKTEDIFCEKMPPKPGSFWATNGQNLALSLRKWHKKNLIGENGGERKINPSANPVEANTMSPDHTAPHSSLILVHICLHYMLPKNINRLEDQTTKVVTGRKRVSMLIFDC